MGAVRLVFGAKLRRHWRSWLLLSLLIAVASGFVLAATAAAGAPPGAVIGIRHALERGRGTRTIPVGTALAGSAAAVAAVCATAVFGTSLAHLTATPELYGAPFQVRFNASGPGGIGEGSLLTELERDRAIDRITLVSARRSPSTASASGPLPRPPSGAGCCCRPRRDGCQLATAR
jgi:hypothetical protein